jgi:hypothetical protein
MFNGSGKKDYSQVNLDDFSDDDSLHEEGGGRPGGSGDNDDSVQQAIRTQQVRDQFSFCDLDFNHDWRP